MAIFTPRQIRLFGDQRLSGALVGHGNKALNQLKAYMDAAGLPIGGPHFIRGDGFTIMVKSVPGIRDFIDVYTTTGGGIEREAIPPGVLTRLLLFWGHGEEKIDFEYDEGSNLFLPGDVKCGNGNGTVVHVAGNTLYGEFVRCWDNGEEIFSDIASGTIRGCETQHYWRLYTTKEIFSEFRLEPHENTMSPVDELHRDCHDNIGDEVFSKTLGPVTVAAFEVEGSTPWELNWGIAAKYNGQSILFDGAKAFYDGAFVRQRWVFKGIYYTAEKLDPLFDVWVQSDGTFMIGACSQNRMFIWRVNGTTAVQVVNKALRGLRYDGHAPTNYAPAVVGYYEYYAIISNDNYLTVETIYPETVNEQSDLKKYDLGEDLKDKIIKTLWHPVLNRLYFVFETKETVSEPTYDLEVVPGTHLVYKHKQQLWTCTYTGGLNFLGSSGENPDCNIDNDKYTYEGMRYVTEEYSDDDGNIKSVTTGFYCYWGLVPYTSYDVLWSTYADLRLWRREVVNHGQLILAYVSAFQPPNRVESLSRGTTTYSTSSSANRYNHYYWISSAYAPISKCSTTKKNYGVSAWNFTPDDIAYHIQAQPDPETAMCLPVDTIEKQITDYWHNQAYLDFSEWEAVLKAGFDRDKKAVMAPVVCYYHPHEDIKSIYFATGDGFGYPLPPLRYQVNEEDPIEETVTAITPQLLGPGDRAFFQQIEIPTNDEWEVIEEETP